MNDLLELKGRFEQRKNPARVNFSMKKGAIVKFEDIQILYNQLEEILKFWKEEKFIDGALISIKYNKVLAKSNRVSGIFKTQSLPNEKIVGAKYSDDNYKHVITYYLDIESVEKTLKNLSYSIKLLKEQFNGYIDNKKFDNKDLFKDITKEKNGITKTLFREIITDVVYIEEFTIEEEEIDENSSKIITLYKTEESPKDILEKIGINLLSNRVLDDTTILLNEDDIKILNKNAPYLISMSVVDFNEAYNEDQLSDYIESTISIKAPSDEPIIGVIDTLFDNRVYFNEWVDYECIIDPSIPLESSDYRHGTAISSIIVDGPRMNPLLEDGCGNFRVKHFGIALHKGFSSFTIVREIEQIIIRNRHIKVWNLSLGSNEEIQENFISAEGAILDKIQYENDVVFVIAGTNKSVSQKKKKIGAPADSINSLVVNSVNMENDESTNYTREGGVLSFFIKPDVSYYGGDEKYYINVCEPLGEMKVKGTSYAAPWVSRKLAYLINIMGFNREVAKGLIIDSAIGWEQEKNVEVLNKKGHGVVPVHIDDIIRSKEDEIKFIVSGTSELYDTYNYKFPVPISQDKHPFICKATLCYFPKCLRTQGVDYTNTELDISFGRIDNAGKIKSIDGNRQGEEDLVMFEKDARLLYRKWDTVKHITDKKNRNMSKKRYDNALWGLSIKTKERLSPRDGEGIRFGVIITLKEINGVNRIEDFIQQCALKGWMVNRINVENKIDIYQQLNEYIELE